MFLDALMKGRCRRGTRCQGEALVNSGGIPQFNRRWRLAQRQGWVVAVAVHVAPTRCRQMPKGRKFA